MNRHFLFILVFILSSCAQKESINPNRSIKILGHAGMGIYSALPINSLESIYKSLSFGADGTELDVQMTKDSVLVAFHNEDLSDVTNLSGKIYEKNWSELHTAYYQFPPYAQYSIVRLDVLFEALKIYPDKIFTLDVKDKNPDDSIESLTRFNRAIIRLVEGFNLKNRIRVEYSREDLIANMQDQNSGIEVFALSGLSYSFELLETYQLAGLTIDAEDISADQVNDLQRNGYQVALFANTKDKNKIAMDKQPDFIQSDRLSYLMDLIDE